MSKGPCGRASQKKMRASPEATDAELTGVRRIGENANSVRMETVEAPGMRKGSYRTQLNKRQQEEELEVPVTPTREGATETCAESVGNETTRHGQTLVTVQHIVESVALVLRTNLSAYENNLVEKFRGLEDSILKRFDGTKKAVEDMRTTLDEVNIVFSTGSGTASAEGKGAGAQWEAKLDRLTPHLGKAFSSVFLSKIVVHGTINLFQEFAASTQALGNDAFIKNAGLAVATVIFGWQSSMKKSMWETGVAKEHSSFRVKMVANAIYNVQNDTLGIFAQRSAIEGVRNSSTSQQSEAGGERGKNAAISKPSWLDVNFIKPEHIRYAKARLETVQTTRTSVKAGTVPTAADIAKHGCRRIYQCLISFLHTGRDKARTSFFEDLGFLFSDWSLGEGDFEGCEANVQFADETAGAMVDVGEALASIPATRTSTRVGNEDDERVDIFNKMVLAQFYVDHKEMVVIADYEVYVVKNGNSTRKRQGGEKRALRRAMNIAEVALNFCSFFCQCYSTEAFLRSNKDSLTCVYVVALVFRELVESYIDVRSMRDGDGDKSTLAGTDSEREDNEVGRSHLDSIKCGVLKSRALAPSERVVKKLLSSRILRMDEEEFKKLSYGNPGAGVDDLDSLLREEGDEEEIEESSIGLEFKAVLL